MRPALRAAVFLAAVLSTASVPRLARANSEFAIGGFGEWVYPSDARGRGMGGIGIGIAQKRNLSLMNPASVAFVEQPTLYLSMSPESRTVKDGKNTFHDSSPDFPLLRGVILPPKKIRLSAALHQWNHTSFDLVGSATPDTVFHSTQQIEGRAGFTALSFVAAGRPLPWLAVGLESDWPFGSYRETWRRVFPDSLLMLNSSDEVKGTPHAVPFWGAGVLITAPRASVGGFIRPSRSLRLDEQIKTVSGFTTNSKHTVRIPLQAGVGVSAEAAPGLLIGAEMAFADWSKTEIDGKSVPAPGDSIPRFRDVTRIGAGLEWVRDKSPRGHLKDRVPIRLGYYQQPWHFLDSKGNTIMERFGSAGIGVPFNRDNGMIDVALEIGKRGSSSRNGLEETIVRFTVGITFSRIDTKEFPQ